LVKQWKPTGNFCWKGIHSNSITFKRKARMFLTCKRSWRVTDLYINQSKTSNLICHFLRTEHWKHCRYQQNNVLDWTQKKEQRIWCWWVQRFVYWGGFFYSHSYRYLLLTCSSSGKKHTSNSEVWWTQPV